MRRVGCLVAIVPVLLLAACQGGPELLATLNSLAPDKGAPASDKGQAVVRPDAKAAAVPGNTAQAAAATCSKHFWGSCKLAAPAPAKVQPAASPNAKVAAPAAPQPAPCAKDFWGNCKAAPPAPEKEQPLVKVALMTVLAPPVSDASPGPPCARDFWGSCKMVAVKPHVYRWHYKNEAKADTKVKAEAPPKSLPEKRVEPVLGRREVPAHSNLCHPRRRVVGEERGSREDAQRAAEDAWMGEVRYDFGERYQDLNKAYDVRHNCNPSTISTALKTSQFRCAVEATPCRAPIGGAQEQAARR